VEVLDIDILAKCTPPKFLNLFYSTFRDTDQAQQLRNGYFSPSHRQGFYILPPISQNSGLLLKKTYKGNIIRLYIFISYSHHSRRLNPRHEQHKHDFAPLRIHSRASMYPAILRASSGFHSCVTMRSLSRRMTSTNSSNLSWPSPPSLPRDEQREFEELQRLAHTPLAKPSSADEVDLERHPDAPKLIKPDFEGDVNPITGEEGGPKREPVGRWGEDVGGDWSFKGRVSDF
jgi:hypothetical protein